MRQADIPGAPATARVKRVAWLVRQPLRGLNSQIPRLQDTYRPIAILLTTDSKFLCETSFRYCVC